MFVLKHGGSRSPAYVMHLIHFAVYHADVSLNTHFPGIKKNPISNVSLLVSRLGEDWDFGLIVLSVLWAGQSLLLCQSCFILIFSGN